MRSITKSRQDSNVTDHIGVISAYYLDQLDNVRSMTKTRQDNEVTDRISAIYDENEIGL